MKYQASILSGILLLIFWLTGCQKCIQHQVADLRLTNEDLMINPYLDGDTLVFKDTSGDSTIIYVVGRKSYIQTKYFYEWEDAKLYHNECQGDYFKYESNLTEMKGNDSTSLVQIWMTYQYSFENPTSDKCIKFLISFMGLHCTSSYGFEPDTIYSLKSNMGSKHDSVVGYYPIKIIGNNTYEQVYELYYFNKENYGAEEWIEILYYSFSKGIVGLSSNKGRTWHLVI
jgi:hypothetical protein